MHDTLGVALITGIMCDDAESHALVVQLLQQGHDHFTVSRVEALLSKFRLLVRLTNVPQPEDTTHRGGPER